VSTFFAPDSSFFEEDAKLLVNLANTELFLFPSRKKFEFEKGGTYVHRFDDGALIDTDPEILEYA